MLGGLDGLPGPQQDALRRGVRAQAGAAPDHFLVALAVLSLLAEAAEEQPLVCLIDDAQWLDRASAQALAFVARRLLAERIAMVFAVREPATRTGSPACRSWRSRGSRDDDARALLDAALPGPLDERVRDRIVAETRGNPLALLELPRGLTPAELAGGFGCPTRCRCPAGSSRASCGASKRSRPRPSGCCCSRRPSPSATSRCCGARPSGSGSGPTPSRRPRRRSCSSSAPGCASAIRSCARRCTGRHPCPNVRRCIARWPQATDPERDPDRRAWHRAHAAAGLDEAVADELERSADRAPAPGRRRRRGRVPPASGRADPGSGTARRARARRRAGQAERRGAARPPRRCWRPRS